VTFLEDGRILDMSKRKGQFVTMDALMDEVGADVAKFLFLMRKPNSHLDFDLDLARQQSDVNPVLKVKYAHARSCSLLGIAAERGIEVGEPTAASLTHIQDESAWAVVRELVRLPQVIVSAAKSREPHRLAGYALEIATLYNQFYNQCKRILDQDPESRLALLHLTVLTGHVLRRMGELIGIDLPESMEKRD